MLTFLQQNLASILIAAALLILVSAVLLGMICRKRRGQSALGCAGGCDGCTKSCSSTVKSEQ